MNEMEEKSEPKRSVEFRLTTVINISPIWGGACCGCGEKLRQVIILQYCSLRGSTINRPSMKKIRHKYPSSRNKHMQIWE